MRSILKILIPVLVIMLPGCGGKKQPIASLAGLSGGKTFAVPTGTAADQFVRKKFPDAKLEYYNTVLDCSIAVKDGKADAAVYDKPVLMNIAAKNGGIWVLPELLFDDQYGFAVRLQDTALKRTMDEVLAELKSAKIYDEMTRRWFPESGPPNAMPVIETPEVNGILRFGTAAVTEPMSFMDSNRRFAGFDIEYAAYIAKKLGKKLEVVDMEFGALIPALSSGKVDMIGAGLSITEERKKKVLFSESYYPSGIAALVKGEPVKASTSGGNRMSRLEDIRNRRIGVLLGSIHDAYATKTFPSAEILQYQTPSDMLFSLNSGKTDVAFYDQEGLKDIFRKNPELAILAENVFTVPIAAGFNDRDDALRGQFNAFLKEIRTNGIYDDMINRWMKQEATEMPDIPTSGTGGPLRVGVVSDLGLPFTVVKDGKLTGFDIELARRFAASQGKAFTPVEMPFGSLIASISTSKIDLIMASMMITEEREKQIDFSDPYYESGVSVIARADRIERAPAVKLAQFEDLAEKKIGLMTGTIHDAFIAGRFPKAQIFRFSSTTDMLASLKTGKVDAILFDEASAVLMLRHNPDLDILANDVNSQPLGVGFSKKDPVLRDQYNRFLKEIRGNGLYDSIYKRWFTEDAEKAVMPPFRIPEKGRTLTVGVSVNDLPYIAMVNGEFVGFDIELLQRFAERENYRLEMSVMEFSSLVAALGAGKVDMITDGIVITPERARQVDFSDSYVTFRAAVVVQKKNMQKYAAAEDGTSPAPGLGKRIAGSFYNNIIHEKRYLHIIDGLIVTMIISIFAAIFGTLVGGLVCYMRMARNRFVSATARIYIDLLRGTPVLVLLMIIYYVVFASVNINPVIVAIIAFGFNFGAYVSEMFRTSIEGVDKGQHEAAIAGGFTKVQTFAYIILPQAMRGILPVYKGEFISLIKMTSIVGYIAVQDLTKASDIIRSRTFDAFFPLIMVAVLYLLIAWALTRALGLIEISIDPKKRSKKRMKEAGL